MSPNVAKKQQEVEFDRPDDKVIDISFESVEPDQMCSQCGHWRTEHDYDSCSKPNWM